MILALFCVLLALAVVGIILGYVTDDGIYTFIGLTFLFILGTYLFSGNLEVETGANVTQQYVYNNGSLVSSTSTTTYLNTPYTGSNAIMIGILLSALGMVGASLVLWNYRKKFGEE